MNMETYRWQLVAHERCRKPHPICCIGSDRFIVHQCTVWSVLWVSGCSVFLPWILSGFVLLGIKFVLLLLKYVSYWLCTFVIQFWAMSHFLHWIMNLSSQPVFSPPWNETANSVFRGSSPPRYHMLCFPWVWNELPWEMLPWGQCWGSQQYRDSTGAQVEGLDMGSCLMKIIVWMVLEIKTHSLCQLVQVHTCCARTPQCHSCQPAFKWEGYFGASGFPFVL